jgi:hypothetical protein
MQDEGTKVKCSDNCLFLHLIFPSGCPVFGGLLSVQSLFLSYSFPMFILDSLFSK